MKCNTEIYITVCRYLLNISYNVDFVAKKQKSGHISVCVYHKIDCTRIPERPVLRQILELGPYIFLALVEIQFAWFLGESLYFVCVCYFRSDDISISFLSEERINGWVVGMVRWIICTLFW